MVVKNSLLFFLLMVIPNLLVAQSFHYCTFDITDANGGIGMGIYDVATCNDSSLVQTSTGYIPDISFYIDSTLNCFHPPGDIPSQENNIAEVFTSPTLYLLLKGQIQDEVTALTCDKQGNIYAAGTQLHTWNDYQITYLGDLPPNMHARGDLTYRYGKLYLSTIQNTLVEVDINNPMNSTVVMTFPAGTPPIHGLATVAVSCDSVVTYAAGGVPFGESTIYEVDFENLTLIPVCTMDAYIIGLAALDECTLPPCTLSIDLDADNSTAPQSDYTSGVICAFPSKIADEDISLISELDELDSIILTLSDTQSAQEYLNLNNFPSLTIQGNNTTQLKLVNNGSSTVSDFAVALETILYYNDAITPSFGTRTVTVRAYYGGYLSAPARAFLSVDPSPISLDLHEASITCNGVADGRLWPNISQATLPLSYTWSNGANTDTLIHLPPDDYQLTVTDALGCTAIETITLTEPDTLQVEIVYNGPVAICDDIASLHGIATGGTATYDYWWSNGVGGLSNIDVGPAWHHITVTDENACTASDSLLIEEGVNYLLIENNTYCFGDTIAFNGGFYWADTTVEETYELIGGCDSIISTTLDFLPANTTIFNEMICQGDTLYFDGAIFTEAINYSTTKIAANGCDSIVELTVLLYENPNIEFTTTGDLCEDENVLIQANDFAAYVWSTGATNSDIHIDQAGSYALTVTDDNGCQTSSIYEVVESPIEIIHYQIDFATDQVKIDSISGGTPPYEYALNDDFFQTDNQFTNLSAGAYTLMAQDANGCTAQVNFIFPSTAENLIFIPNVFSPNDDNHNDHFLVYAHPSLQKIISIEVYSRWGGLLFHQQNISPTNIVGWDGKIKGENAPEGIYVYRVVYLMANGNQEVLSGDVLLVR